MAYFYPRGRVCWLCETIDGRKHQRSLRTTDKASVNAALARYDGEDAEQRAPWRRSRQA